jgi:hypothetical protein
MEKSRGNETPVSKRKYPENYPLEIDTYPKGLIF